MANLKEDWKRMSYDELKFEVMRGGRFVQYSYCISALLVTWRNFTDAHFIPAGQGRFLPGLKYTLLSLVAGWWGIPWGPIYTIASLVTNFSGGQDVTAQIVGYDYKPMAGAAGASD